MKKIWTILLIAALLLSATACGRNERNKRTYDDQTVPATGAAPGEETHEEEISEEETHKEETAKPVDRIPDTEESLVAEDTSQVHEIETEKTLEPQTTETPADEKTDDTEKQPKTTTEYDTTEKETPVSKSDDVTPSESAPVFPESNGSVELEEIPD